MLSNKENNGYGSKQISWLKVFLQFNSMSLFQYHYQLDNLWNSAVYCSCPRHDAERLFNGEEHARNLLYYLLTYSTNSSTLNNSFEICHQIFEYSQCKIFRSSFYLEHLKNKFYCAFNAEKVIYSLTTLYSLWASAYLIAKINWI